MDNKNIETVEELIAYIRAGNRAKYLFFWGHREGKNQVSKACLSQWYESPFEDGRHVYKTAEHFMMAEKARLFGSKNKVQEILAAENPGKAKSIGRTIDNFDQVVWDKHKFDIVVRGNVKKFEQNTHLKKFLITTGHQILVEASPVDKVWGIGLAAEDPSIENPEHWKGKNLLGFALMVVRQQLLNC